MLEELYYKTVNCPVCKNEFKTLKVKRSRARVDKIDTDFMKYYKGENPIKYNVNVCPNCGYSAMDKRFKSMNFNDINIIKEKVFARWKGKNYCNERTLGAAIEGYKLALYCGELLNYKKYEMGGITLRIAWLYRLKHEEKNENRFLKYSLDLYEDAYSNEDLSYGGMDELTVGYLIGEILRRLGEKNESIKWFGNIVSDRRIRNNPRLEKMAREQWQITKGELKGAI